ncbi:Actin-related protein 2/3 complex subunit 2 [Morus notabilis]|uniref:Actin-related protein 2/3 complex subunit 2 n=1 Tax=Morus notabilis TaxID=981085 RepID=W9QX06_9ROSA|nr:Actin-related protein 2/3 complex subunit 2 [Morus notabilis]
MPKSEKAYYGKLSHLCSHIKGPDLPPIHLEKGVELDYHWVEFDDVRYHMQVTMKNPYHVLLSVSLPTPPPETAFYGGLPFGAIEAIKSAYTGFVQILDPPRDGFNLTLKLNLAKLPPHEEYKHAILVKIASVREVVLGAPLRAILKTLGSRTVASNIDRLVALLHRPKESFFLVPQAEKTTVVFPMRFKDSIDIVLATSFLQEFVEARRTAGLNNAPLCLWSPTPPLELKGAPAEALSANAGFVTIVIFPRHVEGRKLERTVWSLSTFHAYVSYHVKALDRAKPVTEKSKKTGHSTSFKRLKDGLSKKSLACVEKIDAVLFSCRTTSSPVKSSSSVESRLLRSSLSLRPNSIFSGQVFFSSPLLCDRGKSDNGMVDRKAAAASSPSPSSPSSPCASSSATSTAVVSVTSRRYRHPLLLPPPPPPPPSSMSLSTRAMCWFHDGEVRCWVLRRRPARCWISREGRHRGASFVTKSDSGWAE